MRILAIVHQSDAGPGVFAEAIRARGARLETWTIADTEAPNSRPSDYDAVLTLGGAMHADQDHEHPWLGDERALLADLLERDTPVLGVCLGAQLLAQAAGGQVRRSREPEIGWYDVELDGRAVADPLLGPLSPRFEAFEWHSYEFAPPPAATALALSPACLQAYRVGERAWGIQFHAEVTAEQVEAWLADYRSDPDAVAAGLDVDALRRRTQQSIGAWNALGRGLCERFLAAVSATQA